MQQSILTPAQRRLLKIIVWGGLAMLANALFLLLFRVTESTERFRLPPDTLPAFYQWMVLGHTLLGIALTPCALCFACWHLGRAWARRHGIAVGTGVTLIVAMLALMISGFFIMSAANSRDNQPQYWAHIGFGVGLPAVYIVHRVTSVVRPTWRAIGRALAGTAVAAVLALGIHVVTLPSRDDRVINIDRGTVMATIPQDHLLKTAAKDPFQPFTAFTEVSKESRFFPSPATTATGEWMSSAVVTRDELPDATQLKDEVAKYGFVQDIQIGAVTCNRCHQDIVLQWSKSAHRFSSMNNPFYRTAFLAMRERSDIGKQPSQWCSGCHEPALMLAGEIGKDFDPDGPNAQAGLTCLSCHAIDSLHNRTGNGAYNIPDDRESPYLFDESSSGALREIGDIVIKAKPNVHKERLLKPFFKTSEYCATCHKVALDVPVNKYRWFRGQNEYDNWHDSGVAQNAARTFYRPRDPVTGAPVKKNCQDCHMPHEDAPLGDVSAKDGKVRSHRFLAVNTALPALRGDTDTIRRIEEFLQDEKMRVDVFALRRIDAAGNETEVITALDRTQPLLIPGERIEVHVVVRNKGVGHTFPGGTNDSNEGFLEFLVDQEGVGNLLHSGAIGKDLQLDPAAHRYGAVVVAHDGTEATQRNPQDFHQTLYANVIGPSTSDVVRYQFVVPPSAAGGTLDLTANLKWRKFTQDYTDFVFAKDPARKIALPITLIESSQVKLRVAKQGETVNPTTPPIYASPDQWIRPNDYGIAMMLKGDTRLAEIAFAEVQRVAPARVDGWRNMARNALTDGNIPRAIELLTRCEEVAPSDRQTAWVWGNALQEDGRYGQAIEAWKTVLDEFPEDRDTWRRLGRTLYLDQKFEAALEAYRMVLAIDPEDREAHYHRMLNLQALGRKDEAAEAAKAYEKYQIDESAQAVTNDFRHQDPHSNLETNPVHAHELSLTGGPHDAIPVDDEPRNSADHH
ncbi:MAG: tetratricopeptide repeat protein [Planctomycetes bacterium]|nr:tetratricopeptide repeat protein [Planctomycetota bacterium]